MADPTPTTNPASAPAPKPNPTRGEINQTWLDEFTNAEGILASAALAGRAV